MAWTLCSKQDVVDIHPVPITDLKDSWSDMVEGLIRDYLGEPNLGVVEAVIDEWHNGDGTPVLRVKAPPIKSVTSLVLASELTMEDGSYVTLSASDYLVFPNFIQLKGMVFPQGLLNVKVSYESGKENDDQVVRLAATTMVVAIVNYRKRFGADSSIRWGAADPKAGEDSPNLNVGLTSHLVTIMKRVLRRNHVRVRYG